MTDAYCIIQHICNIQEDGPAMTITVHGPFFSLESALEYGATFDDLRWSVANMKFVPFSLQDIVDQLNITRNKESQQ